MEVKNVYESNERVFSIIDIKESRACLKNHSCNLHTSIYGIFCLHSVAVARYAALIQAKSPANCDAHLAESIFQTRSSIKRWGDILPFYKNVKEEGIVLWKAA